MPWVDRCIEKGLSVPAARLAFGQLSHSERSKILNALRSEVEMSERDQAARLPYVRSITHMQSRLNRILWDAHDANLSPSNIYNRLRR
jgi:hypothetical protein